MDLKKATAVIEAFHGVPRRGLIRPTFMEMSGYPHYENVCSNILAFFFDPVSPHGLGSLCLDSLLKCATATGTGAELSNVKVEREVTTKSGNKLDILIASDSHLVAIENKIFASPFNPFPDYAAFVAEKAEAEEQESLKILLAIHRPQPEPGNGFVFVSYARFIEALREQLGLYVRDADARYLIYFTDFLNTIANLERGTQMDANWLSFVRDRREDLEALMTQINSFKYEMRNKVKQLGEIVHVDQKSNIRQWPYREGDHLYDVLVHDIKLAPDLPVAVDAVISPQGWEFQIFVRAGGSMERLRDLLQSLKILFKEGDRFVYAVSLPYDADLESVRSHLQQIVDKISNATD